MQGVLQKVELKSHIWLCSSRNEVTCFETVYASFHSFMKHLVTDGTVCSEMSTFGKKNIIISGS